MELFLLPIPAAGHFTSMVSMASRLLAADHRLSVTVLLMTTPTPCFRFDASSCLRSLRRSQAGAGDIRFEELPALPPENFSEERHPLAALFSLYVDRHKPIVKAAVARRLCSAAAASAALVIDFFATSMVDVADDLGIPTYLYFTTSAAALALILHAPTLDAKRKLPVDLDGDGEDVFVELPAMPPTPARAMPAFMLSCRRESYEWFLYHGRRFLETKGIIVNTFSELESPVLDALRAGAYVPDRPTPPVFAVGPVLEPQPVGDADATSRHECIKWLDDQPPASVVFLCFGSLTVFSEAQVSETARGLANSGHRFLWALRTSDGGDSESVLPEEFLKRTAERGKVWTAWAPQAAILSHEAVGGFVTHCGWNSSLEGMWEGVPMLAWPGKAEQHFVAFRLAAEGAGVAMEMKMERRSEESVVAAEELEKGMRNLMEKEEEEGRRVRRISEEMKAASRRAVEVGGSSYIAMQRLAEHMLGINMKINKI